MKAKDLAEAGYYWCTHELAMWIPDGEQYPREWHVVHVSEGVIYHAGADQPSYLRDMPSYVEFYGPMAAPAGQWLPVASAPRDGTRILVHERNSAIPCIAYCHGSVWLADESHYFGDGLHDNISNLDSDEVTHWMPLPPPPVMGG